MSIIAHGRDRQDALIMENRMGDGSFIDRKPLARLFSERTGVPVARLASLSDETLQAQFEKTADVDTKAAFQTGAGFMAALLTVTVLLSAVTKDLTPVAVGMVAGGGLMALLQCREHGKAARNHRIGLETLRMI